MYSYHINYIQ